ncbi:MAG: hypothetical protein WDA09_06445 [Bacteriovoracaceae bacterium]
MQYLSDLDEPHAKFVYISKSKSKESLITALIEDVLASDSLPSSEKGKRLEVLVDNLLKYAGVFASVRKNLKDDKGDMDHTFSLIPHIWNEIDPEIIEDHGCRGVGESKNHPEDKITVSIIYKLEALKALSDIKIGCYFTRRGSTGDSSSKAGKAVIRGFMLKNKSISIVFSDKDWSFLKNHPSYFSALFYEKLCYMRHDKDSENVDFKELEKFCSQQ